MKIYEMVFHKGTYEQTKLFYAVNNEASRQHFLDYIRLELSTELNDFKLSCFSNNKHDLLLLFQEVYQESLLHINAMADDFIQNSNAIFDQFISLNVEEHEIVKLN